MQSKRLASRRLFSLVPFIAVAVGAAVVGAKSRAPEGQIAAGVRVDDVDLSGKSQEEARAALEKWNATLQAEKIVLRFPAGSGIKKVWTPPAGKLGLGIDVAETLNAAERAGHANILEQVTSWVSGGRRAPVAPTPAVDEKMLLRYLKRQIADEVNRKPVNAQFLPTGRGGFATKRGKPGLAVDLTLSKQAVMEAWQERLAMLAHESPSSSPENAQEGTGTAVPESDAPATAEAERLEATLATVEKRPAVTAEMLKEITGVLGSYATRYGGTGLNRGGNIALATRSIHGTLLAPGEIFSYNQVVGPRVSSAGYKNAPVIVKGELVPGIGGGICQVSSTLYNAALMADLKIVRRSHHAFPVHYVPAGRDATVVDGAIDFQFQNDTDAPVYVAGTARGGRLSFQIYGKRAPDKKVALKLISRRTRGNGTVTRRDPNLAVGRRIVKDRGHVGQRVVWQRVVTEGGQVVQQETISSNYRPFPTIVHVGARVVAPKPAAPNPAAPGAIPQPAPLPATAAPDGAAAE